MKRYVSLVLLLLAVLPSCGGLKRKEKAKVFVSSSLDQCDVESVYKEQSLKGAAFSAIRRQVDVCVDVAGDAELHIVKKLEARCADIPALINARPLQNVFMQAENGDLYMAYETSLPLDQVVLFYQREMERSGWQQEAQLCGIEVLMVYKKPDKKSVISVRPPSKKSQKGTIVITQMRIE